MELVYKLIRRDQVSGSIDELFSEFLSELLKSMVFCIVPASNHKDYDLFEGLGLANRVRVREWLGRVPIRPAL